MKAKYWMGLLGGACLVSAYVIHIPEWEIWRQCHVVLLITNFILFYEYWKRYQEGG